MATFPKKNNTKSTSAHLVRKMTSKMLNVINVTKRGIMPTTVQKLMPKDTKGPLKVQKWKRKTLRKTLKINPFFKFEFPVF